MSPKKLEENCYLVFSTVYSALKMEKVLQKKKLQFQLVPIPREISSSCGMAILFSCSDRPTLEDTLNQESIDTEGFYKLPQKQISLWQTFFG